MDRDALPDLSSSNIAQLVVTGAPGASLLPQVQGELLLAMVAKTHVIDEAATYWWDSLPNAERIDYGQSSSTWRTELIRAIEVFSEEGAYLVITDDESSLWPIIRIPDAESVVSTIGDLPFFEFFFISDDATRLVFDTHHNSLVISNAKGVGGGK